jgi:peptidoglycan hydrolase-like protein with peptidoglycan-binding domain
MSNGWLDPNKYQHIPITSCTGPGTMMEGYAWKFVLHTTEGPPGSIEGVHSLFKGQPCSAPHFCIDPEGTRRRAQYIPWTMSACALRGGQGGWQTNRGRAVQMEIVGFAKDAPNWPDETLWQIADVVADCIRDGCPINAHHVNDWRNYSGTLATQNAAQRMSGQQWQHFDGLTAHVEAPFNDHWDTGRSNGPRIADFVRQILAGAGVALPPTGGGAGTGDPGMLRVGQAGGIVKFLQELLIGLGYSCGPAGADSVFGGDTDAAVRKFQADQGLEVDGIAGPMTTNRIGQLYAGTVGKPAPPPPSGPGVPRWPGRYLVLTNPNMGGADVNQWQAQMASRGWQVGVDGVYGPQSAAICKSFQSEKNIQPYDAVVGPKTWGACWTAPVT